MKIKDLTIQAVPTNIITGFLGVGKTTAILHLLKHKPTNERWAVLVNEFGEIGVDGSLLNAPQDAEQGIFIREVSGGCMCCAAGVPMQVALNQLLNHAKPDRLLIEPTGLGHPKEVLRVLSAPHYKAALSLQKTITLVDARNLSDTRYTNHDTFNQQIAIADIVMGNKADLCQSGDKEKLLMYVEAQTNGHAELIFTEQGAIALTQLEGKTASHLLHKPPINQRYQQNTRITIDSIVSESPMPATGFIKAINKGEGYNSIGWRFSDKKYFNYSKLTDFFTSINPQRLKAVVITEKGIFSYNFSYGEMREAQLSQCLESRIEIIFEQVNDKQDKQTSESWQERLLACVIT